MLANLGVLAYVSVLRKPALDCVGGAVLPGGNANGHLAREFRGRPVESHRSDGVTTKAAFSPVVAAKTMNVA